MLGLVGNGVGFALAFFWPRGSILVNVLMPVLYLFPGSSDRHVRSAPD